MTKLVYLLPGQGAQAIGMGKAFYDQFDEAKAVFQTANRKLGFDVAALCFEGPAEDLMKTEKCQPALFVTSMAAFAAFKRVMPKSLTPLAAAGLSLGEYSALAASGVLSFEDTLRLVQKRAAFMEEATNLAQGKMAAIIGFDKNKLMEICRQTGAEVANFNSPEQIVITGHAAKVEEACRLIKEAGAKNVIPLEVGGAFHSSLMKTASEKFQTALEDVKINTTNIPVISNVDAQPHKDAKIIRENLAKQIISSVQWVDSIQYMAQQGISDFIEIGPGRVLRGLMRRTNPDLNCQNIEKLEDLEKLNFTAV